MNTIDIKKLNHRLATWVGFRQCSPPFDDLYKFPAGVQRAATCSSCIFTSSIKLCFEWLEPKLEHYSLWKQGTKHVAEVWVDAKFGRAEAATPNLAFCLAVEKLIDGEIKSQTGVEIDD